MSPDAGVYGSVALGLAGTTPPMPLGSEMDGPTNIDCCI